MGIAPAVSTLNAILREIAPPLECSFEPISRFQDWEFEDRLKVLTESHHFPIVGFDYNSLFGELLQEGQGHCAVVYRVQQKHPSVIEIYDPGPDRAGFKDVDRTGSTVLVAGSAGGSGWSLCYRWVRRLSRMISALMNFGAGRASAEVAVTKARSSTEPNAFDALFRRALKLVR